MSKIICIVDDQPGLRQMLRFALNLQGLQVFEAESSADALEVISSHRVDMVIVDGQMPEMDCLGFVRCLRKMHDYAELPVIIISCREDLEARQEARSLGGLSWMKKPFRIAEIQAMVENDLGLTSLSPRQGIKAAGRGLH